MIGNNMTLLGLVLLYWLSIAFYNFTSLSVAQNLTTGKPFTGLHTFLC